MSIQLTGESQWQQTDAEYDGCDEYETNNHSLTLDETDITAIDQDNYLSPSHSTSPYPPPNLSNTPTQSLPKPELRP